MGFKDWCLKKAVGALNYDYKGGALKLCSHFLPFGASLLGGGGKKDTPQTFQPGPQYPAAPSGGGAAGSKDLGPAMQAQAASIHESLQQQTTGTAPAYISGTAQGQSKDQGPEFH